MEGQIKGHLGSQVKKIKLICAIVVVVEVSAIVYSFNS